jgi:hypothetical protein
MTDLGTQGERRDDSAADRDDAAQRRDLVADVRDDAADRRDDDATERDQDLHQDLRELDRRVGQIRSLVLDHLSRVEGALVEGADWPDLTPAGLGRLHAHLAEQRHLAGLGRAAVATLFEELHNELGHILDDRLAAADDRHAAARDRRHSGDDRRGSAHDRDLSAQDRGQATIDREQVDPGTLARGSAWHAPHSPRRRPSTWEPSADAGKEALAESRQRIADSREQLGRTHHEAAPPATAGDEPPLTPDP